MSRTSQTVLGTTMMLIITVAVIFTGNVAEGVISDKSKLLAYLVFIGWPVLNYILIIMFCVKDGYFINIRVASFVLVHLTIAAIVLRLN